jgi:hypothetical protein
MAQMAAQTQNLQANAALTGTQDQGAQIANQGAALKLGLLQNYYGQNQPGTQQGPSPAATPTQIGSTGVGADDIAAQAVSKYAPLPTAPPASAVAQDAYAKSIGAPELAVATYKAQVDSVNQQKILDANASYQTAETVASSDPGTAWATLNRINPQAAAGLKQKYADATPDELDADVRSFAQHIGIATHQYTGRDTDFQNGVLVDKKDGKPVLGSEQVLTGLDAAGKQKAFEDANSPITLGDGLPGRKWQGSIDPSTGRAYTSAESYVIAADKAARSSAAATPPTQQPAPGSNGAGPGGNLISTAGAPNSTSTSAPVAAPKSAAPGASPASTDPVLQTALNDNTYRYQPPPKATDQPSLAANTEQAKANVASRNTLKTDSSDATAAAAQAQTYLQAAQSIMASKGANLGAYGGLIAKASALMPGQSVDATNYQEVAKYLGNAALANARGIYGNRMTQSEVQLQLNELSPSVHMTDTAVNNLLNTNLKASQYTIDSARRVMPYLAAGNDATNFKTWNQQYFDQGKTVNGPSPTPTRPGQQTSGPSQAPAAGTVRGGYKFTGGNPADKTNWVKQ